MITHTQKRNHPLVISFSILLMVCENSFADFASITDPALRACVSRLAIENNWQTPEEVTHIKCHNAEIKSAQGLDKFTHLRKLSLYKNEIEEIVIPPLAELEHLNIAGNKLTRLHLKNLPSLREFFVFKNKLESLTFDQAPNLSKLKANNNQLTELRFNNTQSLQKLYVFDNELKELNMKSIPALSYFDARHNPMPDEFYDYLDSLDSLTALHDGNAEDWQ